MYKSWLLLIVLPAIGSLEKDPIWAYHQRNLHTAIEQQNWYAAKSALSYLSFRDRPRYQRRDFELTRAWIAHQEGNWGLAHQIYARFPNPDARMDLTMAQCLVAMDAPARALTLLNHSPNRFRGTKKWQVLALKAKCHRALKQDKKAIVFLRLLAASKVPFGFRMPAQQTLVELYYHQGDIKRGRLLAENLQIRRASSDAALFSVYLQEVLETTEYLENPATWNRFARVLYKNREFERSNPYYEQMLRQGQGLAAQRARYFLSLTYAKQGKAEEGLRAFKEALPHLVGGRFEGPANFQMARMLFMNRRDREVIQFVESYWRSSKDPKWRYECIRLMILALRRSNQFHGFERLENTLIQARAPDWLFRFYNRNGVVWALARNDAHAALDYLHRYRRYGLGRVEKREALLWEGVIRWALGEKENAIERWLELAVKDPNQYFGLVARNFIHSGIGQTQIWQKRAPSPLTDFGQLPPAQLKQLYYLTPSDSDRQAIGLGLRDHFDFDSFSAELQLLPPQSRARQMAEIGRYDLACESLRKEETSLSQYYFYKARWHQFDHRLHSSIRFAEILLRDYPRWVPYELLSEKVQKLNYPKGFAKIVEEKASTYKVDPYLLLAIIREESRFNSQAKSWASARGLMQFIPSTATTIAGEIAELEDFSVPMLYDPKTSITLGARYVDKLMHTFDGVSLYTIAAYNAGEGAVERWRGLSGEFNPLRFVWDVTYDETKRYCQKVLRAYHHYTRVYHGERHVIVTPSLNQSARM